MDVEEAPKNNHNFNVIMNVKSFIDASYDWVLRIKTSHKGMGGGWPPPRCWLDSRYYYVLAMALLINLSSCPGFIFKYCSLGAGCKLFD
jgi:hypothetical protein